MIKNFPRKKENTSDENNVFGENNKFDRVIVMDNVSALADRSNDFGSFLTIARKINFTCVYVFHIIYPSNDNFTNKNFKYISWIFTNIFDF